MIITYRKTAHPCTRGGYQGYEETSIADTLSVYDISESRTPILVVEVKADADTNPDRKKVLHMV